MTFKDLREYLVRMEDEGELIRVKEEVDWNLEFGAILMRASELRAPAPFCESLSGYPKGYRVTGGLLGPSLPLFKRCALALGMPKDKPVIELIEEFCQRINMPIKPRSVRSGSCKENILVKEKVDLYKFPVPHLRKADGGRYIGTWHFTVVKDRDSNWINWGTYRVVVHDKNTMGIMLHPQSHGGIILKKYESRGESMPIALAIGTEPICTWAGTTAFAEGVNEADMAGGIRKEAVELIECETSDLLIPAHSEIVIEGEIKPGELRNEGPFGEYTGYMGSRVSLKPVVHVKCITFRDDPILTVSCPGKPVDDHHPRASIGHSATLLSDLKRMALPVKSVYCPPSFGSGSHCFIVSAKPQHPGFTKKLASAIWSCKSGQEAYYIFIVDEDIDPANTDEVLWAFVTRCHPGRNIIRVPNMVLNPLPVFTTPEEKKSYMADHVLFDATFPAEWPADWVPTVADFKNACPKDLQDRVTKRWKKYGYV